MGAGRSKGAGTFEGEPEVDVKNEEELYFDLSRQTRFQRFEIRRLHGAFRNIQKLGNSKDDALDADSFAKFFCDDGRDSAPNNDAAKLLRNADSAEYFYKAFLVTGGCRTDALEFPEFAVAFDKILLGGMDEKIGFILCAVDPKNSGLIPKGRAEVVLGDAVKGAALFERGEGEAAISQFKEWASKNLDVEKILKPFDILPTVDTEKMIVKRLYTQAKLKAGDTWYVLSQRWWQAWKDYVSYDEKNATDNNADDGKGTKKTKRRRLRPISIENADLSGGRFPGELKKGLVEGVDYTLVPKGVWNKLVEWYGGGPEYPRKVIELGVQKMKRVEVFPLGLQVGLADNKTGKVDQGTSLGQLFSIQTPLAAIHQLAKKHFKMPPNTQTRLWVNDSEGTLRRLTGSRPQRRRPSPAFEDPEGKSEEKSKENGKKEEDDDGASAANGSDATGGPKKDEQDDQDDEISDDQDVEGINVSVGDCDVEDGDILIVECYDPKGKKNESPWPLERVESGAKNWRQLEVGSIMDAKDRDGKWYRAEVIKRDEEKKEVRVHFQGWSSQYDEWIPVDAKERFAPPGRNSKQPASQSKTERTKAISRGVVGLRNLGNTCFMNSTLQCLSNTPIFNTFFSGGRFRRDINKVNPLGTKGKLAHAFGNLLREIWMGSSSSVAPSAFKRALGQFAPRFSGYQQQDSQELLAYLLDGLHEDLNRVKKKKPTNTVEAKGRADHVVAEESWKVYQLRNRSVIVDLFMGQLKSTVVCPDANCGNVSVTFDPFMYLSVPFPRKTTRRILVHLIDQPPKVSSSYVVVVEANGRCDEIISKLAEMAEIEPSELVIGEVYKSKIYRLLGSENPVDTVRPGDVIVAYYLPGLDAAAEDSEESFPVPVIHTQILKANDDPKDDQYTFSHSIGLPLMLQITSKTTNKEIHKKIHESLAPFIPVKDKLPEGWFPEIRIYDKSAGRPEEEKPLPANESTPGIEPGQNILLCWKNKEVLQHYVAAGNPKKWSTVGDTESKGLSVHDCVSQFCKKETLSKNDAWYCSKCKNFQEASKKLDLFRCPEILIVHLKRFVQRSSTYREKISDFVDFPIKELNLSQYIVANSGENDAVYDLFAVSNHMGGIHGGHYTAFARNHVTNRWYLFDDSHTREVNINSVRSSAAYVLYYQRRH